MSTIGKRILKLRKQKKLSQEALGKKANVSDTYIGKLEKDKANATLKVLEDIADALETTVNYLRYGESPIEQLAVVPETFLVASEAKEYIKKHPWLMSKENIDEMSDKEALSFANDLLSQMTWVSYKYKK
ncbi:helix-turn-helix domain-containing protein [Clostridium intestinale]|uniref:Helix-turn-helix transcriptional regulator n=1 Tax=Clostridium intestinale TaxID=36845 RepID=A0A7D6VPL7_9CLOT|nr:helix-turn-helix transcriptional regulator [Clostridium intestinale]QLY77837.1 helix-turn-helix transcriptional regulator [Clostridium intestinale]